MKLKDQVAIITGGGRGMGEAHSMLLSSEGATVYVLDKNGPNAEGVAKKVRDAGGKATAYELDITKGADVRRDLATTIVRGGWGLLELRPVRVSLEDIFLSLTTEEVATAEPAAVEAAEVAGA